MTSTLDMRIQVLASEIGSTIKDEDNDAACAANVSGRKVQRNLFLLLMALLLPIFGVA